MELAPSTQTDLGAAVEDVSADTRKYIWEKHRVLFITTTVICVCASIILAVVLYLTYSNDTGSLDEHILSAPIFPLLVPFAMYGIYRIRVQHLFVQQMAAALGYTYAGSASSETVSGTFFTLGHSVSLSDVMTGTYKGHPVRIYTYQYTVGSGKNSHTYTYTVFEMNYGAALPHIIVNLPELFAPSDMEKVELEGNFNKDFTIYVAKGQQMEVREIFQPDMMEEFIESFASFSMEISGTNIYLMKKEALTNKKVFLDMVSIIDKLFYDMNSELEAFSPTIRIGA